MKIIKTLKVPTGKIFVTEDLIGRKLEFLSIGDYGQAVNLNQNKPVPEGLSIMPLTEKWVVTVSTQHGCSIGCIFCDAPKVGPGTNALTRDIVRMVDLAVSQEDCPSWTKRLNIHFARMGEPTFNFDVIAASFIIYEKYIKTHNPHPVVSTMMPKHNSYLHIFLSQWMEIKNHLYEGNAGLQLSINSTDENERSKMFNGNALELVKISELVRDFNPVGRKITLNFAVADYTVDCDMLAKLFNPDKFIVKLTPMHKTDACEASGIRTSGEYTSNEPYKDLEERFKKAGFETLVFIASKEEDDSRITCGNAILSGSMPKCEYKIL